MLVMQKFHHHHVLRRKFQQVRVMGIGKVGRVLYQWGCFAILNSEGTVKNSCWASREGGYCFPPIVSMGDNVILENGDYDIQKLVQHCQRLTENAVCEGEVLLSNPAKLKQIKGSTGSLVSVQSKDKKEILVVEDGKEVLGRSTLQAPPGIPFSFVSVGGACRAFPLARTDSTGSYDSGGLLDTDVLTERMQLIATQGLEGASMECANLSINGLDAYLKKLIKSCINW